MDRNTMGGLQLQILFFRWSVCEDMEKNPQRREKEVLEDTILEKEFKRPPCSTRAAAGICVTNIVGGEREKNHQRRREEVPEKKKFYKKNLKGLRAQPELH